jgi:hypothetical protein
MYAQVITPGFLVVLEAGDERYEYHTNREGTVVLCEEEAKMDMPTMPSPVETGLESHIALAKEDLAQRLSISADQMDVVEARSVVWPDASLGCPQPEMRYKQVPQDGALIRLSAEGRVYEYHSGPGPMIVACDQEGNPVDRFLPIDPDKINAGRPWVPVD